MTSQQNDKIIYNYWFELINLNQDLLSDESKHRTSNYSNFDREHNNSKKYENCFWFDGSCDRTLWTTLSELLENKDRIILPKIDSTKPTIFFTYAEGWCTDNVFNTVHGLIDLFGITGYITFQCASVNVEDMYNLYCEKNNQPKLVSKCIYENWGFLSRNMMGFYIMPSPKLKITVLPYEEKILFTSLNWNNWPHRQSLLGLMNFHDLIDDGIITSPCMYKHSYDTKSDYDLMYYSVDNFFKGDQEHDAILKKLPDILKNYPLVLDDRSKYATTEEAVSKSINVGPIFQARVNGLIEVIPETLYSGEHFFSEKTFWAMILNKPFIMVCGHNALKSLRKIGFKTFAPYIDESYDEEENGILRLKKITLEVKRLKELRANDPVEFKRMYDCMIEIASHNRQVFHEYITGKLKPC
jgi:hypothetical protein